MKFIYELFCVCMLLQSWCLAHIFTLHFSLNSKYHFIKIWPIITETWNAYIMLGRNDKFYCWYVQFDVHQWVRSVIRRMWSCSQIELHRAEYCCSRLAGVCCNIMCDVCFIVKQVFKDLDFLGWYNTGELNHDSDIKVHKQVCTQYI